MVVLKTLVFEMIYDFELDRLLHGLFLAVVLTALKDYV